MSGVHDAIVVGAGVNGLVTAARLGRAGRRVVVLERRAVVGGLAAAEEFHPRYRSAGVLQDTTGLRPRVVSELQLESHGLRLHARPPDIRVLLDAAEPFTLRGDAEAAAREIAARATADAAAYRAFHGFLAAVRPVVETFLDRPAIDPTAPESLGSVELARRALRLRRLGAPQMLELLRVPPMSVADWLGEWFSWQPLMAALAVPAIAGTFLGPRSPGGSFNLLLHEGARRGGVAGAGPALVAALDRCARAHGVEIRTSAKVDRLLVHDGRAIGVALEDGTELRAPVVAASCDPRTLFLELVPPGATPTRFEQHIRGFRARGTTAQVLLALDRAPRFGGGAKGPVEFARVAGSGLDDLERAFDAVKYGRCSDEPALEVHVPTVADPSLAPEGHAVVSLLVHFAPHDPETPWDAAQRDRLADRAVAVLERYDVGLGSAIVARRVWTPADLATVFGLAGGHVHHGEHALDQRLLRPCPECVHYRTPLEGLYLCGAGVHPGGGLTGAPGLLAAEAIEVSG